MHDGTAIAGGVVYRYDGSFEGFLCCVYDRYTRREQVLELWLEGEGTLSLYPTRTVETVAAHADRVFASLPAKLGQQGLELLQIAFLAEEPGRETDMLRFVELGYAHGPAAAGMLAHPAVNHLHRLWRNVTNETHRYKQFLRFEEVGAEEETTLPVLAGAAPGYHPRGLLVATIEPKNHVLSLIAPHFCDRYPQERMLIHDAIHGQAMLYQPYQVELLALETLPEGLSSDGESFYEGLWKNYCYNTAILARRNPRCQMNMMPKRYWPRMVEMRDKI